jgi:protein involved in polysaccharide export with SLBB domain
MFQTAPSTFAPVDNIPVTPDYVVGPGDEIRLQIWGQLNQRGSFVVDRTGSISLPQVGTIHVAGLQFSQLTDFLRSQLSRVYRNFDLNVNLGQLRSIQVFVVGQARQPGSYTIGSLSTLLNALFASGGPLPQGSLRDIQVKRGNETITHFDLYDLLLHGDKSKDVRLISGDVIFIPPVGPEVAVAGSVTTPAIYELRGEKTFSEVIALAGGLSNVAAGTRVQVQRIDSHAERSMINVDLATNDSPPVQDGDIVSVLSIIGRFKDAVTLRGNVADPGRFAWHEGMRISDLIPNREALITRDYYRRLIQLGQTQWDFREPSGNTNAAGYAVQNPTGYSGSQSENPDMTRPTANSSDYNRTGAVVPEAEGQLAIQSGAVGDAATNRGTLGSSGGGNSVGAAITPGNINFNPKTDVVLNAPDIDWKYAVIERQSATDLTTSLLPFNLSKAVIDKDPSQDLQLLPGDVVSIFSTADIRVPTEQQTKFVKLEGEFAAAGVYSVLPGETLRSLLVRAGGLTPQADLFASEFTRENVRRLQKQRLLEYADQLDAQISASTLASTASALTDRDSAAATAAATSTRAVVARLRQIQPTGRIVLDMKPNSSGVAAVPELELQDGDRFVVPRVPSTVSVTGQVYNSNAFLYQKGRRVKDYMRLAGGPDRIGDRSREFVLRADGSVVSRQYGGLAQHALFADRNFDDVVLNPGDTIIVPPILQKGALLRTLTDVSTIVSGFGLGVAAINVLK